jgi:hypothetical protein
MKKLTFMNVKEEDILTREEMRNVMAGSGGCTCQVTVDCPPNADYGMVSCIGSTCSTGVNYVECDGVHDYCFDGSS